VIELSRPSLIRSATWLRRVIQKVVSEQFLEDFEVPSTLDLLGIPSNDGFRRFALGLINE
jgi:hypothetical protein